MAGATIKRQLHLNPYEFHKYLINEHVLTKPGSTKLLHMRDTSKDKTDKDVIFENNKFLWEDEEVPETWEKRLAKKYYDKLFKEYCICDMSRYKDNKIAMRWRIEKEVVVGKGQFICGEKDCKTKEELRSWEINFAYNEEGEKKNALVKLRLCPTCSDKLNFHSKKREIKRLKKNKVKAIEPRPDMSINTGSSSKSSSETPMSSTTYSTDDDTISTTDDEHIKVRKEPIADENLWKKKNCEVEDKSRDAEFDDYLEDLLL
ncbi:unnamed protein product [Diamesa tonsa]